MSSRGRPDDLREPLPQSLDDLRAVVHRQGGLREIGHFGRVGHLNPIDVRGRLHQADRLRRLAHRSDHFVVAGMADRG